MKWPSYTKKEKRLDSFAKESDTHTHIYLFRKRVSHTENRDLFSFDKQKIQQNTYFLGQKSDTHQNHCVTPKNKRRLFFSFDKKECPHAKTMVSLQKNKRHLVFLLTKMSGTRQKQVVTPKNKRLFSFKKRRQRLKSKTFPVIKNDA